MKHDKIFKRADGTRYRVYVSLYTASLVMDELKWDFYVHKCEPRKKTFRHLLNTDDYRYRKLSMEERRAFERSLYLQHVTAEEIIEVKLELWNKIKPE